MVITTSTQGAKALVGLAGKLTVQTSPEFSAAIDGLPVEVCDFDIDLGGLDYVASAGLRALAAANAASVRRGGTMRLLNPASDIMETFEMTGLSEVFTIV